MTTTTPPTTKATTSASVLLVGRRRELLEATAHEVAAVAPELQLVLATTLTEADEALATGMFEHVVTGGGPDLDIRLRLVATVFAHSDVTSVHLKDVASGPQGLVDFLLTVTGRTPS